MRIVRLLQRAPHELAFALVVRGVMDTAQQLEAKEYEVGVGNVGLAVIADLLDLTRPEGLADFRAVHAELSGKAAQAREIVQGT